LKIILLEDDELIAEEIKLYFEIKNHSVECYLNGEELLENANIYSNDLFLLDINMPIKNGIETLKEIREMGVQTPAIFLTSMSDIETIKIGYEVGCSDYIRKPFHFEELELRINKLVLEHVSKKVQLGPNQFYDTSKMELSDKDKIIDFSENEKNLIYYLVKNLNHVVHSNTLMDYVWDDKIVNSNTLRTQIKKIRSKLSYDFIQNIRGTGYKIENFTQDD
jgi:DNA-binding response OmpR family regulator